MRTIYDPILKATVTLDDAGQVRGINHLDEYREIEHLRGREAATAYVRDIAGKLNITPDALRSLEQRVSYLDPQEKGVEYRFSDEKASFDSATYAYYQTYLNTPVWAAAPGQAAVLYDGEVVLGGGRIARPSPAGAPASHPAKTGQPTGARGPLVGSGV